MTKVNSLIGSLPGISGTKIVESSLAVVGLGVKKQGEDIVYLSKADYLNIQNAKSQEELRSILKSINIIEVPPFAPILHPDIKS